MLSRVRTVKVCFVTVLAVTALAIVSGQAEAANYFWVELVSVIETNKEILATIEPGTKFNIRGEILGASMVIECGEVALKHGVIFNDSSSTLVGQDSGELELKVCLTSFCPSVSATIKIPILGNGDSTLVADEKVAALVTQIYDDFLPNAGKEFAEFTISGGGCGLTPLTFVISTAQTRGGLGEAKEGESGILGQVDGGVAEAAVEQKTHKITFACSNKEQLPQKAWDSNAQEIMVDKEELSAKRACLEGKMVLELDNKANFSAF